MTELNTNCLRCNEEHKWTCIQTNIGTPDKVLNACCEKCKTEINNIYSDNWEMEIKGLSGKLIKICNI